MKNFAKRDSAGSFTLPDGASGITRLCSLQDHVEIFTEDGTYMMQTPETIDPGRTNPDTLWVNAKVADVGSASPAVARSFIMAYDVLKQMVTDPPLDKDALLIQMHVIKQHLVECETGATNFEASLSAEIQAMESTGGALAAGGRTLARFPMVKNLNADVTSFLVTAKRTIREICHLLDLVWKFSRSHSALTHVVKELTAKFGEDHRLVQVMSERAKGATRIVTLRDGQEHKATTGAKLHIDNFRMLPSNEILIPVWFLDGDDPTPIADEMQAISEFLIDLTETAFIGSIYHHLAPWPPQIFEWIDPPDPKAPMRYRLTIDAGQLNLPVREHG